MAGRKPFFLTGANAKIKVNGVTLAFCTNLSYSVQVTHATPHVLGMYEATSIEPTAYKVSGTFTIIKYVADAVYDIGGEQVAPDGVSARGNGVGSWSKEDSTFKKWLGGFDFKNGFDARAYDSLTPKELHKASGFVIEVFQDVGDGNFRGAAKIRNARITQADFSISKKSAAQETFAFTAIYIDEDTFIADASGIGQQFA